MLANRPELVPSQTQLRAVYGVLHKIQSIACRPQSTCHTMAHFFGPNWPEQAPNTRRIAEEALRLSCETRSICRTWVSDATIARNFRRRDYRDPRHDICSHLSTSPNQCSINGLWRLGEYDLNPFARASNSSIEAPSLCRPE